MLEMATVSYNPMAERAAFNATTSGPSSAGAIPSAQQVSNVRGTGWATPFPIRPPDGVNHADRLMDEQDRRDRAELAQRLGKR